MFILWLLCRMLRKVQQLQSLKQQEVQQQMREMVHEKHMVQISHGKRFFLLLGVCLQYVGLELGKLLLWFWVMSWFPGVGPWVSNT